jgi:hypothetical protein
MPLAVAGVTAIAPSAIVVHRLRRFVLRWCVLGLLMTAACGNGSPAPSTSLAGSRAVTTTSAAGLVGRWQRVVSCHELATALDRAGLAPLAQYAWLGQTSSTGVGSFAQGSPPPTTAHPCRGALNRTHSHFFTADGKFGSLDWLGDQVDDGTYRILGARTVQIGGVTFHYEILHKNTLAMSPVITTAMLRKALAHPRKFSSAGWAVSVAYPGSIWKRVPCQGWC